MVLVQKTAQHRKKISQTEGQNKVNFICHETIDAWLANPNLDLVLATKQ